MTTARMTAKRKMTTKMAACLCHMRSLSSWSARLKAVRWSLEDVEDEVVGLMIPDIKLRLNSV
jgi:hypothetical protein